MTANASAAIAVPLRRLAAAWLAATLALVAPAVATATPPPAAETEIKVKVERRGALVVIDVEFALDVGVDDVWAVMTDYDRMADFVSSVKSSHVTRRDGDTLEVAQSGEKTVLFMKFAFAGVKSVELTPKREIRTRLVEGDFKSFQSSTRIVERPGGVTVLHHGEYEPKKWVPPMIGPALIEAESRRHYREVAAEIRRRKGASAR